MSTDTGQAVVVTDDPLKPTVPPTLRVEAIQRVYSPSATVAVVTCRDLETALALVRVVSGRGNRTRLYADPAAARRFAEDLIAGRATWAPDEP